MTDLAANKQLPYLFVYSLSILFVGMGLLPLLPLYAGEFGASPKITGLYFSIFYISFTASTMLAGLLATRFGARRVFILFGVLGLPTLFLMGQVTAFWQLVILTAALWFFGGAGVALVNVFTGLSAGQESRGRWFSLISLTAPLGALLGGLIVGRLVDGQGYAFMFAALTLVWVIWPVLAYFKVEDITVQAKQPAQGGTGVKTPVSEKIPLLLLLLAILFAMMTINIGRLGLPLVMELQLYTPGEVATVMALGGLVTLPFAFFLGLLSDRLGRKTILILGYLMAALGVLILIPASASWQFWLAGSLLLIALTVSGSVASAFATDLLSPAVLVKVLPWFTAVGAVAGILGFTLAGYLIEALGFTWLFVGAAGVALLASALLWPLRCERQLAAVFEPGWSCDLSFRPASGNLVLQEAESQVESVVVEAAPESSK